MTDRPDDPSTGDPSDGDPSEEDPADLTRALHAELRATEELPVDPAAGRWIDEARAVAADAVDAPPAVVVERARQVRRLLREAPPPGDDAVADRLTRALSVAERIVDRTDADDRP